MKFQVFRRLSHSGSAILVAAQWIRMILQMISLVALSQLLAPSAFGLVAMATAFTGVANIVGDFGLSLAALTGDPLDQNQRSKLFRTNVLLGCTLTVVVAATGPVLARFYGAEQLVYINLGLAPIFLLNAVAVQYKVELNIRSAWRRLASTETIGPIAGLVVALIVASTSGSYWALVLQPGVAAAVQLPLAVGLSGWRPSSVDSSSSVRSHLRFGRHTLELQAFTYASSNVDNVVVGHSMGSSVLGQYSRAYQLAMLPIVQIVSPLTRVMLPKLVACVGTDRFDSEAARLQKILCYVLLAPLSLLIATAGPLVAVIFGSQWGQVPELLQILAVGAVFVAVGYVYYWIFLALNAIGTLVITEGSSRVVMIAAIVLSVREGTKAVALSVAGGQVLLLLGSSIVGAVVLHVGMRSLVAATIGPLCAYSIGTILALTLDPFLNHEGSILRLTMLCAAWVLGTGLGGLMLTSVRRDILRAARTLRGSSEGKFLS